MVVILGKVYQVILDQLKKTSQLCNPTTAQIIQQIFVWQIPKRLYKCGKNAHIVMNRLS